jgi:hypothetical protein
VLNVKYLVPRKFDELFFKAIRCSPIDYSMDFLRVPVWTHYRLSGFRQFCTLLATKSISNGVQYVSLNIGIGWRKGKKHAGLTWGKIVSLLHVWVSFAVRLVKRRNKAVHLQEKSVINTLWLLLPVFDWAFVMIGPGGLLLVVPNYMQFYGSVQYPTFGFMGGGVAKK